MKPDCFTYKNLPVIKVCDALLAALTAKGASVLVAPPGSGKSTGVPLFFLHAGLGEKGRILLLSPRRMAARAIARRMADLLGESLGETVGYRIRGERKEGPLTNILVVTEGVLTRMIQKDPELSGIGTVIFDEYHERHLVTDLGLALVLDAREGLRPDLGILVMSATLEANRVADLLGGVPVITSEDRAFPVSFCYRVPEDRRNHAAAIGLATAKVICSALQETTGNILAFLPGLPEIRRASRYLEKEALSDLEVLPLYGGLGAAEQDLVFQENPKKRRVILATAIAETSVTIRNIRVVIDSGWVRQNRMDVATGVARLETVRISQAGADQRAGRAGRTAPGICYRLWPESETIGLVPFGKPEILRGDLTGFLLETALWGVRDPAELRLMDAPVFSHVTACKKTLIDIEAIDGEGRITRHGKQLAGLGVTPEIGHLLLLGKKTGQLETAAVVAAILSDRDPLRFKGGRFDPDLFLRIEAVRSCRMGGNSGGVADRLRCEKLLRDAMHLAKKAGKSSGGDTDNRITELLAKAFFWRIAKLQNRKLRRYRSTKGVVVQFPDTGKKELPSYLVVLATDGKGACGSVRLSVCVEEKEIEAWFENRIITKKSFCWDSERQQVRGVAARFLGEMEIASTPCTAGDDEAITAIALEGILRDGLSCLPWDKKSCGLLFRMQFISSLEAVPESWQDWREAGLKDRIATWLGPFLYGRGTMPLKGLDLSQVLTASLSHKEREILNTFAPSHIVVPSGSKIPVSYEAAAKGEGSPVLAVRLQEVFGLSETPKVGCGRVGVLLHLLSPASRPLQVTGDLAGFWNGAYESVKKEMKGRYPRHYWPDNPLAAAPTAKAKMRKS